MGHVDVRLFDPETLPAGAAPVPEPSRPRHIEVAIREAAGWTFDLGDAFAAYLRAYRRRCGGGSLIDATLGSFDGPGGDTGRCDIAVVAAASGAFRTIHVLGTRRARRQRISADLDRRDVDRVHMHRGENPKLLGRLRHEDGAGSDRPCLAVLCGLPGRVLDGAAELSRWGRDPSAHDGGRAVELWVMVPDRPADPQERRRVAAALTDLAWRYVATQTVRDTMTGADAWHTFHVSDDRQAAASMRWAKRASADVTRRLVPLPGC